MLSVPIIRLAKTQLVSLNERVKTDEQHKDQGDLSDQEVKIDIVHIFIVSHNLVAEDSYSVSL